MFNNELDSRLRGNDIVATSCFHVSRFTFHEIRKKNFLFTIMLLLIFSLASCTSRPGKKYLLDDIFTVKPPSPDTVTVAVLPVQNATFRPMRIGGKRSAITKFMDELLHTSSKFQFSADDITFVPSTLQTLMSQHLYVKRFNTLDPPDIRNIFLRLGIRDDDKVLDIEELTAEIPADWLLLVTIHDWNAEKFESRGWGRVSYSCVLIDTRLKKAIWEKSEENVKFIAPKKHIPYSRQGGPTLHLIAKRMLRDFSKPEPIEAYRADKKVVILE